MSLFKSRSGGSLYRFRAISGYVKYLFDKSKSNNDVKSPTNLRATSVNDNVVTISWDHEEDNNDVEKVSNLMKTKYEIESTRE